ncbi:MAG: CDP-alcohol phosphatidyltransferase family protein [Solirubrobacterales bacterium]|nr:CDP-alcohol phosphatidyltransferase family protein [Solirubrobacterales bacterium]
MVDGPRGEPREALSAADAITYARMLAAPAVLSTSAHRGVFLSLLAGGALSDGLDGRLARRDGTTRLGRDLDAAADVAFLWAAGRAASRAGWLAHSAAVSLGVREPALVGASALFYFLGAAPPPAATVGATRFAGPLLTLGLALSASGRRKLGSSIVIASTGAAAVRHLQALGAPRSRSPCPSGARPGLRAL